MSMQLGNSSPASSIASLSDSERKQFLERQRRQNPSKPPVLLYDWKFWARPKQLPPQGQWRFWLNLSGRGVGKTRTGAEFGRASVDRYRHITLCGAIASEVRDVMVEGES